MRCGICGDEYSLGPPSGTDWVWYPRGEAQYWAHTIQSPRHQAWLDDQAISGQDLLNKIQDTYKAEQRRRANQRAKEKRLEKKRAATQQD